MGAFCMEIIMAMLKLCPCNKIIPLGLKRCEACERKRADKEKARLKHYDRHTRDKDSTAFYNSKSWKRLRLTALVRDNYLCVECLKQGITTDAKVVDHIIPIKADWGKRLDIKNLQSLCAKCHSLKTIEDLKRQREPHTTMLDGKRK